MSVPDAAVEPVAIIGVSAAGCGDSTSEPRDLRGFDADYFGIAAREAPLAAPPQRLLLEGVCAALESACYDPDRFDGRVALYASVEGDDEYLRRHLVPAAHVFKGFSQPEIELLASRDLAPLWVSRQLGLEGPSVCLGAGAWSCVAAVHIACQALRAHECEMAIAGGVVVSAPSADSHSREANHHGHADLVVLKTLKQAVGDGDSVRAVVLASGFGRSGPDRIDLANTLAEGIRALDRSIVFGTDAASPKRVAVVTAGPAAAGAHLLLEGAPDAAETGPSRPWHVLTLSSKSPTALDAMAARLRNHLRDRDGVNLADVAYSLHVGRKSFGYRRAMLCATVSDAVERLGAQDPDSSTSTFAGSAKRPVVFMFPGAGAHYLGMGRDLYATETFFREEFDRCCEIVRAHEGTDLRSALYSPDPGASLDQPVHILAGLFAVEYALARLWMRLGVHPESMIGHSLGEYVAACLSGVFTLEDALKLVAFRGRLFETVPAGAMLSIALGESEVTPLLTGDLSLAGINAPALCVVSGPPGAVEALRDTLSGRGVETRLLPVARAGHSSFVAPIMPRLAEFVATLSLGPPRIPYMSNYTGTWITDAQAVDPGYWAAHLRHTVRFADGFERLLLGSDRVFLEVGPGKTLSTLGRQHPQSAERVILSSMRHVKDSQSDAQVLAQAVGQLWTAGVRLDSAALYAGERRRRLGLPTYPFERRRHWVEAAPAVEQQAPSPPTSAGEGTIAPRNELEVGIARIWRDLIGAGTVSVDRRFGDLGGSEASLGELRQRLAQEFGAIPEDRCTLGSTVAQLADLIAERALEDIPDDELSRALADLDLPAM